MQAALQADSDIKRSLCSACQDGYAASSTARLVAYRFYITPRSFLDLLVLYSKLMQRQQASLGGDRDRLVNGLTRLRQTNETVDTMQQELTALQPVLHQKTAATQQLLAQVGHAGAAGHCCCRQQWSSCWYSCVGQQSDSAWLRSNTRSLSQAEDVPHTVAAARCQS